MYNKAKDKQISLSYLSDELAQVWTKKKESLTRIEEIIPRGEWEAIIQPCYYKGERGNKPYAPNLMLHLHMSDEATSTEVIDLLTERGLILKKGTIVDSTLISAPSSTKNREKKRVRTHIR